MIHEPDFCPLAFTREQIDYHAAMVRFYEPLANAREPESIASRQLRRHLGLVDFLTTQYRRAVTDETSR